MAQGKYWCFTLNNPATNNLNWPAHAKYAVWAHQKVDTDHLQGYVEFDKNCRLKTVKEFLPTAHWEVRRGTAAQARDYCMREETRVEGPWEHGTFKPSTQGKRNDLETVAQAIADGASIRDLYQDHPVAMIRYGKGIKDLHSQANPVVEEVKFKLDDFPTWEPVTDWSKSYVFYGPAGTGKTQFALAHFKTPLLVSHMDGLTKFDAATHDGIVFDDMSFRHLPRESQIHVVDQDNNRDIHARYQCASIPRHTKKIFTCNEESHPIFKVDDTAIDTRIRQIFLDGPCRRV